MTLVMKVGGASGAGSSARSSWELGKGPSGAADSRADLVAATDKAIDAVKAAALERSGSRYRRLCFDVLVPVAGPFFAGGCGNPAAIAARSDESRLTYDAHARRFAGGLPFSATVPFGHMDPGSRSASLLIGCGSRNHWNSRQVYEQFKFSGNVGNRHRFAFPPKSAEGCGRYGAPDGRQMPCRWSWTGWRTPRAGSDHQRCRSSLRASRSPGRLPVVAILVDLGRVRRRIPENGGGDADAGRSACHAVRCPAMLRLVEGAVIAADRVSSGGSSLNRRPA